jgi:hypothetical protein
MGFLQDTFNDIIKIIVISKKQKVSNTNIKFLSLISDIKGYSALKTEAVCSSEMVISICNSARPYKLKADIGIFTVLRTSNVIHPGIFKRPHAPNFNNNHEP